MNFMVLDNKKNIKLTKLSISFDSLIRELSEDTRITEKEKCVLLYQLGVLIGNDIYDDLSSIYPKKCNIKESMEFLINNSDFISY